MQKVKNEYKSLLFLFTCRISKIHNCVYPKSWSIYNYKVALLELPIDDMLAMDMESMLYTHIGKQIEWGCAHAKLQYYYIHLNWIHMLRQL